MAGVERMLGEAAEPSRRTFPRLFAADPPDDVIELPDTIAADVRRGSVRVALAAMAKADLRDALPSIAVPTLLSWGEFDARSPLGIAYEFAREIPHAELVVIPRAGYMSNLERPEEFNAAIRTFCGRRP